MNIKIDLNLKSPELMAAILGLSETLSKGNLGASISSIIEEEVEVKEGVNEKKEKIAEKIVTLEEVRRVLATKSKNGKQAEVKELIKKYGVNKLTDIHPCNYKELFELAEVL